MSGVLWLTDRSRYEVGLGKCPRERYLEYHRGPGGYGMRLQAVSMPQARGIYIHEGVAILFAHLQAEDALPEEGTIRAAVKAAVDKYTNVVEARGLQNLDAGQVVETIIKEQCALLTGTIWTLALELLPWWHAEYRVVSVEQEEIAVLGCTCGLGDLTGNSEDHVARECAGVGWMSRADVIGEHRLTGRLAYFEIKTGGMASRAEDWETKIQFSAAVLGVEQRLERPIDESWVLNLLVGKREGAYNYETKKKDGPPLQQSIFCYGYKKPAPAPGMVDEWAAQYDYQDDQGRNRKLTKDYRKAGVWEIDPKLTGGLDPAEFWVRWIGPEVRQQQVSVIGPLNRQAVLLEGFKEELLAVESDWQGKLWALYDVQTQGHEWGSGEFQSALNALVPRSWACNRFGQRYQCAFVPICFKHEGWDDPLGSGRYMLRAPHHQPEREQMLARGIEIPAESQNDVED